MSGYNVILLMTDQQRADHSGYAPNSQVPTPNIDRIAESAAFLNCQTADPICTPARCSLLTGKYAHQVGMTSMSGDLNKEYPTYPQALQKAGYYTMGIGKFHILQSWPWGTPVGDALDLLALEDEMKEYGFDYIQEFSGKQLATHNRCQYIKHLEERGLKEKYREYIVSRGKNIMDANGTKFSGDPWPFEEEDYIDSIIGDRIVSALKKRPKDKPFFLFGSFMNPHQPYDPPSRYLELEEVRDINPIQDADKTLSPENRKRIDRIARAYRASIRFVDDQIGRIFNVLEEENLLDNTVILFTSDHGEMLGDHARMHKKSFYRSSLTVPAAIRHPDYLIKRKISAPVELTDITATILDAAGINPQEELSKSWPAENNNVPCRSLLPILRGETEKIRDYSFSECNNAWQALQSEEWKYVRILYHGVEQFGSKDYPEKRFQERLFNLKDDPQELTDESLNPQYQEIIDWFRRERDFVIDTTPFAQTGWAPYIIP
jgi:arylsulfatase